jgi:small-conductance mechanosensitive channel
VEEFKIEIIESTVVLISFIVIKVALTKTLEKVAEKFSYQKPRVKIFKKIINLFLLLVALGILFFIWEVGQSELVYFVSTLLTILGIAFFAQWSIISNITATIIIFFNHPVKIGDTIIVYDKDYPVEGRISDIGIFFVILKTIEGEIITMPSNVFIQKMIKKIGND